MPRPVKPPFLRLLVGSFLLLIPKPGFSQPEPLKGFEPDSCINVDLTAFEDPSEVSSKITQCSYEFTSSVLKLLDDMIDANILGTYQADPDKAKTSLDRLVKLFREREWVFPFLIANKDALNSFEGIEIIPAELFNWIVDNLVSIYLEPISKKTGYSLLFVYMFGGDFSTRTKDGDVGKIEHLPGLLQYLKEIDLQAWSLIDNFSEKFVRTLLTKSTTREVSKTFVALVKHYFEFMHVQNRIHILTRMADLIGDPNQHNIFMAKLEEESEAKAEEAANVHLFQNTGPVFVKLLQTLNEAIKGKSFITPVLAGIKKSFPMPSNIVQEKLFKEIRSTTDKTKGFSPNQVDFTKKPLGIASIGQVHKFKYEGQTFVVKIRKEKIEKIFARERESILQIVSASISGTGEEQDSRLRPIDIFDKGIKQRLNNYMDSIAEEMDFRYERNNLFDGAKAFTDPLRKIAVADIPKEFAGSKSSDVLVMKLAKGKEIGDILEEGSIDDQKKGITAVETLYEKYLRVALDPRQPFGQYYHGDLHRGNFFLDADTMQITLIDFGNAGKMDFELSKQITRILVNTQRTETPDKEERNKYIQKVSKDFYQIAKKSLTTQFNSFANAKYYKDEEKNFVEQGDRFLRTFFTVCFNPDISRVSREIQFGQARDLSKKLKNDAGNLKRQIKAQRRTDDGFVTREMFQLTMLEDNIGLLDAIRNNCLAGFKFPITGTMAQSAEEKSASDKLQVVFQELEKNGIAMPREIALFNKSKGLLEGIMKNFTDAIKKASPEYNSMKNANSIFAQVVNELNRGQQVSKGR